MTRKSYSRLLLFAAGLFAGSVFAEATGRWPLPAVAGTVVVGSLVAIDRLDGIEWRKRYRP